ncbi:MAG: hypothetical protein R2725_03810 [Solirubrobacterales bacterium]
MRRAALKRLLAAAVALAVLPAAGAGAAVVLEVDDLVLRADARYRPQQLPRHRFAPIAFSGFVGFGGRNGRPVPALQRAAIAFDHDGRLGVAGLPRCDPARIEAASTREARRACRGAIVGRGTLGAVILLPGDPVRVRAALTVFNGPRLDGRPTAILHARTEVPVQHTYAIVVPITRSRGDFRYRVAIDVPPLAGGLGRVTRLQVRLDRRYRAGGKSRSYLSARCSDSILRVHGYFRFADGTVVSGALEKFCDAR